jgi:hypothetical protein
MEAAERAEILRELQAYGTQQSQAAGLEQADLRQVLRRSLNPAARRRVRAGRLGL